jgi:hypothetical protein
MGSGRLSSCRVGVTWAITSEVPRATSQVGPLGIDVVGHADPKRGWSDSGEINRAASCPGHTISTEVGTHLHTMR